MNSEIQYPINVEYCGACTMPLEYCEYAENEGCRKWLQARARGASFGPKLTVTLRIEKRDPKNNKRGNALHAKKHKKDPEGKNRKNNDDDEPKIAEVDKLSKLKTVTVVNGLASFGVDQKEAINVLAKAFGCGVATSGINTIVVQGDHRDKLMEIIPQKWERITKRSLEDLGEYQAIGA